MEFRGNPSLKLVKASCLYTKIQQDMDELMIKAWEEYTSIKRIIATRAQTFFICFLRQRFNLTGSMRFDHINETLDVFVSTQGIDV